MAGRCARAALSATASPEGAGWTAPPGWQDADAVTDGLEDEIERVRRLAADVWLAMTPEQADQIDPGGPLTSGPPADPLGPDPAQRLHHEPAPDHPGRQRTRGVRPGGLQRRGERVLRQGGPDHLEHRRSHRLRQDPHRRCEGCGRPRQGRGDRCLRRAPGRRPEERRRGRPGNLDPSRPARAAPRDHPDLDGGVRDGDDVLPPRLDEARGTAPSPLRRGRGRWELRDAGRRGGPLRGGRDLAGQARAVSGPGGLGVAHDLPRRVHRTRHPGRRRLGPPGRAAGRGAGRSGHPARRALALPRGPGDRRRTGSRQSPACLCRAACGGLHPRP